MRIIDMHAHTGKWAFHTRVGDNDIAGIMDEFNIEKAIFSSGRALMDDMITGNEENYHFINSDSRFYGYVVINQNKLKESEKELGKYLGKKKIVGVKMHPEQFNHPVNSTASKTLVKIIDSYGLPILIHTAHSEECRPSSVLEIAQQFPNNKYILAHMGNAWWKEAIETASKAGNIFTDIISSWCAYDQIKYACDLIGAERVLFGSDMTLLDPAIAIGMVMSSEISDVDKEKVFYKNALKLFNFNNF